MIECLVCKEKGLRKLFKRLGSHIKRVHKIAKEEYLKRFPDAKLDDDEFVRAMRDLANKNWQDPNSVQNSQTFRDNQSKIAKEAYADPNSGYHKEGYLERQSEGIKKSWTEERREEHAKIVFKRWRDSEDGLNSNDCRDKMSQKGRERWEDPLYHDKIFTDETLRKLSKSSIERWRNPVYRRAPLERMSALTSSRNERRMRRYLSKALRRKVDDDHEFLNEIQLDAIDHVTKVVIEWDGPWHRILIINENHFRQIQGRDKFVNKSVVEKGYRLIRVCDDTDANIKFCYQKCREILKIMFDEDRTPRVISI